MKQPVDLPVSPMLAKAVKEVPAADSVAGGLVYEPKWDGFRCLAFRDGDAIELRSKSGQPLGRYFPDIVAGLGAVAARAIPIRATATTSAPIASHRAVAVGSVDRRGSAWTSGVA